MSPKRKLLGYVVKLPDGTRSPLTRVHVSHTTAHGIATHECPVGSYIVPVFATRKPQPVVRMRPTPKET